MPPDPHEAEHPDELSDYGTDDPEEIEREVEEDAKEAAREMATEVKKSLEAINRLVEKHMEALDKLTFESQVLDAAGDPVEDANEDAAEEDDKSLEKMKSTEKSVLDKIWSSATELSKKKTVQFFLAALGIAGAVGAEKLIEYFEALLKKKDPPAPAGMSKDDIAAFKKAVDGWADMEDPQYWKNVAKFARKHSSTMADLVFFMQYTVKLFPSKKVFIWKKTSDQSRLATTLANNYKESDGLPDWVEDLGDQKYQDAALPRSIAAGVARLALAHLINDSKSS